LIVSARPEVFCSTRMLRPRMRRPAASKNIASVTPLFIPSTKMRRGVRSTAWATAGLLTRTSRASTGRSTTAERPTGRESAWLDAPEVMSTLTTEPGSSAAWLATGKTVAAAAARPASILSKAALRFMARTPFRRACRL